MTSENARFAFGENWRKFLPLVDEPRIRAAERSLCEMLEVPDLTGKTALDVGCGSGLFSLAARRLGARVRSFDRDQVSVDCTLALRRQHFPDDDAWQVEQGSVLDAGFVARLGQYDVVYAWGVLHHTGAMWQAFENTVQTVRPGGRLFVAIYNDQGRVSDLWRVVKRAYCSGTAGKVAVSSVFMPYFAVGCFVMDLARLRNPLRRYRDRDDERGMAVFRDWVDWLGGYPFEVAKPEKVLAYHRKHGFRLDRLTTRHSGCNEFVFTLSHAATRG
ncbi:MAG: class I SAM-dependent methyltransferase [Deltaproteobacteria bacterium]|nr:class I SAM-dependent methyltransferase [Deltaproteobacteria bacterium]